MSSFSSKIGVLLAAAGSAIGLGSIWKFPYVVGQNGGGAFIVIYVVCSLVFGLPLVMNEFMIGKLSRKSAYGAFCELSASNRWQWLSWVMMLSVFLLLSFYFVVTGWCIFYMVEAAKNTFDGMDAVALTGFFNGFEKDATGMTLYAVIAIVLTASVLWFDVNKGIERLSKILMPLLFVMLIVLAAHMVLIDGGTAGLRFLFEPDFSKITPNVFLEAVGLSFFTLSIGVGALITYGGYMPKDQEVTRTSIQMIVLVLIVSLLAGMIVLPAVFAYGFSPTEGPQLTFVTLPEVFQNMVAPALTSTTFFALMCVAAITSTISMMEVMVAFVCEASEKTKCPMNRHHSVVVVALILVLSNVICILSMTGHADWLTIMGHNVFDYANNFVTDFLIPVGALTSALYAGWFVPQARYKGGRVASAVYLILLRWIIPIAIFIVFLNSLNIL
ncbi:MAG: sodium-dependent transporter [Bacteroidaceae bacterium]|nr:sodium-dependent transporter [Bacteroidaceae bacterium]